MFIALEVNSYQIYVDFNLAKHIFTTNANNPLNTLNFLYNSLYLLKLSTGPWSIWSLSVLPNIHMNYIGTFALKNMLLYHNK